MLTRSRMLALNTLLLGIALAFATGCTTARTQQDRFTLQLPPNTAALALDIENFNGSISVRADSEAQDTLNIESLKFVDKAADRDASESTLSAITVAAEIESDGPLAVLRVRSISTAADDAPDHGTNLTIHMPRADGVRIHNSGGHVSIIDAGGTVDINNVGGSIEFATTRRMTESVTLITHNGEVYYQVPLTSTGDFDMLTLEGRTTVKDRGTVIENTYAGPGTLQFVLNDGDNPVVMRSNRGNVRVWVMDNPTEMTRTVLRDKPIYRDRIHLKGTRRHTRDLPTDTPRTDPPMVGVQLP
ncbi:MAG: hypothetical protein ACTS3F_08585 [Phycisphaerales bacterium]